MSRNFRRDREVADDRPTPTRRSCCATQLHPDQREYAEPGLRKPDDVKRICNKHAGTFQCLLFDADTRPQSAYVLVKDGDVDGILAELGGGATVFQYFDPSEVK